MTITPELPSGETLQPMVMEVILEGEGRGAVIVSALDMPFRFEGLHWFHVRFDGRIITRLPLDVRYNRII